jgi:hypothetical protein
MRETKPAPHAGMTIKEGMNGRFGTACAAREGLRFAT